MSGTPALRTEQLGKRFGATDALRNLDLEVARGDPDAAARAADTLGYPLVAKLATPELHKTEAGGVRLGLANEDDLRASPSLRVPATRVCSCSR